jgi:hypothetical protein
MRERDAEGRPVATRNAGAFLSPVGMIPVPSSLLDEQRERDGATAGAVMRISLTERTRWALAIAVAIAAWSLMAMALRLVLIATEPWKDIEPLVIGQQMTIWMHTDVFWVVANALFLAIGVKLGIGVAPSQGWRRMAFLAMATVVGAVAVTITIEALGEVVAAFLAGAAVVWLVVAHWMRT